MPIPLGIFATAGAGGAEATYELISSTVLGSATASVNFSSIPSTYKHLQIRLSAKSTGYTGQGQIRLNGVSSTVYSGHIFQGNGSAVSSSSSVNQTFMPINNFVWLTSNSFTASIIDIMDYTSTSKYKTMKALFGRPSYADGNPVVALSSGLYMQTSAITSISFQIESSGNYATDSRFSLYGIKG